tara:strand:+ start:1880 stop:2497 length:618 start_codon:yes stop_codon:yes gene_type:complete
MSFKKNKYKIIKQAVPEVIAHFLSDYLSVKREVASTFFRTKYISPYNEDFGCWTDEQIPNTYSHYADIAMETLLLALLPKMEKESGHSLVPTYSYTRIYKNGDELKRHRDRDSCEISTTIHLGGDEWPIYLEPSGEIGMKGKKINLQSGDMLMYKGCELEHWREPFTGEACAQVFLHYNRREFKNSNQFDGRPHVGLPGYFRKQK